MRAPARLWRCEPPTGPADLSELTLLIRVHLATRPTPLEKTMAKSQNRPLTPEEEDADRRMSEYGRRQDEDAPDPGPSK
ncbi:hypothetical protein GCM10027590_17330 [Nocardiopsis nanhaiensis]